MDMREMFTIDGRRFSNMAGFYDEVEQVFICGLDWKIGRNLNAFNDILRGGFGRHEYGQPIHIQWLAYEKSVRNLGKETMDTIVEIILDTDHSGHLPLLLRYWVGLSCRSPQILAISVMCTLIVLIIDYLRAKRKSVSTVAGVL